MNNYINREEEDKVGLPRLYLSTKGMLFTLHLKTVMVQAVYLLNSTKNATTPTANSIYILIVNDGCLISSSLQNPVSSKTKVISSDCESYVAVPYCAEDVEL